MTTAGGGLDHSPLILRNELLIGGGQVRRCYHHPGNPALVVKVAAGRGRIQQAANEKELRGYQFLLRRHGRLEWISHCHGFVATNRGQGLLCDCIRNADGTIARTIWDEIHAPEEADLELLLATARRFCAYLIEHDIWLFDLNLKNIALVKEADHSSHPVILDLKGRYDNNELIPFSSYIPFLARKKRARRAHQLLERIRYFHRLRHQGPQPG